MVSYHTGFLYLADSFGNPVEIVNEARTAAALTRVQGLSGGGSWNGVLADAGCQTLRVAPCTVASDGSVTSWASLPTTAESAPWYSGSLAFPSSDAIGFLIDEWTGLDAAALTRQSTPRGSYPYGASFGVHASGGRVMSVNLIALGRSERGLQHLFRWLEHTLMATCSPGATQRLWMREYCPAGLTTTELEDGLVYADEVALVSGPVWVDPPVVNAERAIRKINFTLVAGNPCWNRVPGTPDSKSITWAATGSKTPSAEVSAACDLFGNGKKHRVTMTPPAFGYASATVKFESQPEYDSASGTRKPQPAFRIIGFADYDNRGVFDPCTNYRVGLIHVDGLLSGHTLEVDCATGAARWRDPYGPDRDWVDGSAYIQNNASYDSGYYGLRRIQFTDCENGYLVVEPAMTGMSSHFTTAVGFASGWTTTITTTSRFGCS